jgi:hypothetical protein
MAEADMPRATFSWPCLAIRHTERNNRGANGRPD